MVRDSTLGRRRQSGNHIRSSAPRRLAFLVAVAYVGCAALAASAARTPGFPEGPTGVDSTAHLQGVVSVSQPLAAHAGAAVLARGGNAIDAAAAIQFALNVVEPMMTGIGGGAFVMVYSASDGKVHALDGRERAPASARANQFLRPDGSEMDFGEAESQGIAVGVPGTLLATATVLKAFGTMTLAEVMQPAIQMARDGIPVSESFAQELGAECRWKLEKTPGSAYTLFDRSGALLKAGDLLVQTDLANALQMISERGTDALYRGPIGVAVTDIVRARGGSMEVADLETYQVHWREPVHGTYRGWDIVSMPPPSSGGLTLVQMLMMLERFDMGALTHNGSDALHAMIEAMHLGYADRAAYMGDPDFVKIPVVGLLDRRYVADRSALIRTDHTNRSPLAGDPWAYEDAGVGPAARTRPEREGLHTTHFVTSDRLGNVVAWTTTIEDVWGSGIMVPGYGFMLNNELTDFDFTPGGVNEVAPMGRPRSSMAPTILLKDGTPWMATGSPGGTTIIATVMQVVMNVIDHGMGLQEAVEAPRVFSGWYPEVLWEDGIPESVRQDLTLRFGYKFDAVPTVLGSAQSLVIDLRSRGVLAVGDPRWDGTVVYPENVGKTTPDGGR